MKGQTNTPYPQNNISARVRYFSSLTVSQQKLVLLFKKTQWGTMHNLAFYNGEPIFRPPPKIKRIIRLAESRYNKHETHGDFKLKKEFNSFFDYLEEQQNGCITFIDIRDGLPAEMSVEEVE
jgi:hypothetical protein